MRTNLRQFVIALALASVAGTAIAAPDDDDYRRGHDRHYQTDWQHREEHRRDREHHRRALEWQREQRAELRRRAEWQRQRDHEWQRQQQAELRRRAAYQRHYQSAYAQGYRDASRWQRGQRYHGRHYVVRDYGHYHLRRPPHNHHWVRADDKYLLVAIATGLIIDIATR